MNKEVKQKNSNINGFALKLLLCNVDNVLFMARMSKGTELNSYCSKPSRRISELEL